MFTSVLSVLNFMLVIALIVIVVYLWVRLAKLGSKVKSSAPDDQLRSTVADNKTLLDGAYNTLKVARTAHNSLYAQVDDLNAKVDDLSTKIDAAPGIQDGFCV